MEDLTKEEVELIVGVLNQLTFKPGASQQIVMVERLLLKLSKDITEK